MAISKNLLFEKMQSININVDSKLNSEDLEHMRKIDSDYKDVINLLKENIKILEENKIEHNNIFSDKIKRNYVQQIKINSLIKKLKKCDEFFCNKILNYIKNKYEIKIEFSAYEFLKEKSEKLNYKKICEKIFETLNGLTFKEKQIYEAKNNFLNYIKNKEIKLYTDKLKIKEFTDEWQLTEEREEVFINLFKSFLLFENMDLKLKGYCKLIIEEDLETYDILTDDKIYLPDFDYIKYIKIFKNGSLDIKFRSSVKAKEFTRKFTNFI